MTMTTGWHHSAACKAKEVLAAMADDKKDSTKKSPLPDTARGLAGIKKRHVASAAGSSAGTSAAAASAAAERVGGSDGKARAVAGVNEINLDGAASLHQIFVHQKLQPAFFKCLVAVFWLIQSQSK